MPDEREASMAWLTAVMRSELPVREGPYALGLAGDGEVAVHDGRHLGLRVRLVTPAEPMGIERTVALLPADGSVDRARGEAFLRAWCFALRRAFRDLATSALPDAPRFTAADLGTASTWTSLARRRSLTDRDAFDAALAERRHFGRFFAITPTVAGAALERVYAVLTEKPPVLKCETMVLRALTTPWNDDHPTPGPSRGGVRVHFSGVVAAFELSLVDESGVRERKQQELEVAPAEHLHDLARVEAFLRAWREVLPEHVRRLAPDEVAFAMPHNLYDAAVLSTPRAVTRADFRAAFERRWQFRERDALRARNTSRG